MHWTQSFFVNNIFTVIKFVSFHFIGWRDICTKEGAVCHWGEILYKRRQVADERWNFKTFLSPERSSLNLRLHLMLVGCAWAIHNSHQYQQCSNQPLSTILINVLFLLLLLCLPNRDCKYMFVVWFSRDCKFPAVVFACNRDQSRTQNGDCPLSVATHL